MRIVTQQLGAILNFSDFQASELVNGALWRYSQEEKLQEKGKMREQVGDELVWSCSDLKSMFERLINSFNIVKYHWMMIVEDKYIEIFTIQMSFDPIGPYAAISMSDFFN